jgi:hypothetical protein
VVLPGGAAQLAVEVGEVGEATRAPLQQLAGSGQLAGERLELGVVAAQHRVPVCQERALLFYIYIFFF